MSFTGSSFSSGIAKGPTYIGRYLPTTYPSLLLWADPFLLLGESGGLVSSIHDRSRYGNDITASGTARAPLDSINGFPAYLLDGGVHAVPALRSEITTAKTMIMVYDRTSLGAPPAYSPLLGSNATYYDMEGGGTPPNLIAHGASVALRGQTGGGSSEIRINGEWSEVYAEGYGGTLTQKPSDPSVITIWTTDDDTFRFDNVGMDRITTRVDHSRRGDLVLFSDALAPRDVVYLEDFLLAKYNIEPSISTHAIVFTGNSIVAGHGVIVGVEDFPSATLPLLTTPADWYAPNLAAYNVGVGGQTTPEMIAYDPRWVDRKVSQYRTSVVVMFEGSNDIHSNNVDATTCFNNLMDCYYARKAACPNAIVLVPTILPRGDTNNFNPRRNSVNTMLRAAIPDAIIDFAADPVMGPDDACFGPYYQDDTVHPVAAGQAILAGLCAAKINAVVP